MKKIILLIFIFSFLGACQATKDALTLKKKDNSDVKDTDFGNAQQVKIENK